MITAEIHIRAKNLGPARYFQIAATLCQISTRPRLFADDTNLTASGPSITDIENAVNSDLQNLRNWLIANRLSLNVTKTEFMLIGSPQMIKSNSCSQPNILIENKRIQQVDQSKSLGITIDQHLSWKPNTENICKKQHQESQLYVVSNHLLLKKKHLSPYMMLLYGPILIIVLKFGMYLVKYNANDCKSSKTEQLELY